MGNWFGTSNENHINRESANIYNAIAPRWPVQTAHTYSSNTWDYRDTSITSTPVRVVQPRQTFASHRHSVNDHFGGSQRRSTTSRLCKTELLHRSPISFILDYISDYSQTLCWDSKDYSLQPFHLVELMPFNEEYQEIAHLFNTTNKKYYKILHIERIQNPFLLAAFLLKMHEMEKRIGSQSVVQLFHGTKQENVKSICSGNFNWRLHGKNVGKKFGQGVSFTPISNYATHYSDEELENSVMFVVDVLVGKECIGISTMVLPPEGYDTTIKENRQVIVKYEDNEFYPTYKITYHCTNYNEIQQRMQKKYKGKNRVQKQINYFSEY